MTDTLFKKMSAATLVPPHVMPAAAPLPLWRFLPTFVRNPLASLPASVYRERFVQGVRGNSVWVTAPDLIERLLLDNPAIGKTPLERRVFEHSLGDGILTSEGASWKWQRRTAAPLFRHADLLALAPTMVDAASEQVAIWRADAASSVQAISRDMEATTFKIISRTIFAGAADAEGEAIQRAGTTFLENISWEIAFGIVGLPKWVWHPGKWPGRRAADEMRSAVASVLERRRAAGAEGNDITARLIRARDPETGAPMSDSQLIDNLLTFLAAGHETTAKALTWALYLLARAPEWQQKLHDEAISASGDHGLDARSLDALVLTKQVVKETMRLYPPAPVMTRITLAPMRLDDAELPAGTTIVIPIYALHRHEKLWESPGTFDPVRFTPEREAKYARAQFMPFGFGPRICIGMSFAMIEATLLLATFVRAAQFGWDGAHLPEPVSRITLRPRGGMPLIVTIRK